MVVVVVVVVVVMVVVVDGGGGGGGGGGWWWWWWWYIKSTYRYTNECESNTTKPSTNSSREPAVGSLGLALKIIVGWTISAPGVLASHDKSQGGAVTQSGRF